MIAIFSGDTEMGEATENNQTASGDQEQANQETTGQDAAILSTASIAESIVESVLGTSSGPVTTTATPSFSGLLTLLSPVSSGAPTLPLQEPPVSSVPAISGSLTSGVPSAPATPQTTTVSSLPPFPSPATSTSTPTLVAPTNTSSLEVEATSSTLTVNDTEMVAASPLPATGSTPISQDNVEALAAQEETPMSVSPPEYPSQSPELLASSGDAASTPPLPQVTPRDDWYDPSMTMQQDPPQDQSEDQAGAPPELAMPPAAESNTEGRSAT